MLMPMSTNHPGDSVGATDSLETLVGSSEVPLAAVELPSGQFLAVNSQLAKALGSTIEALTGSSSLDQLSPDDRRAAQLGFQALAEGGLTGYQAIRTLTHPGDPDQVFSVWVSVIDLEGTRVGLASVIPAADHDSQFGAMTPLPRVPELGNVVLGTVDASWRIDRVSQDVAALLGITPDQCAGQSVLGLIHPSDAPAFLAAVEHARQGERAVRLSIRLSPGTQGWTEVTGVIATISGGIPPALAFALIRGAVGGDAPAGSSREMQLEAHMQRIAEELRAAGLIPRLERLPVLTDIPQLGELTSREWAVLTRLLEGQRPSAIAADLFVSRSTVRNHLSSIYAKLGVHSQVDLIRLIRHGTRRPADSQ
jgi:DNA-binding CsgD family transcriptional regulator/PAS domain-containing protein